MTKKIKDYFSLENYEISQDKTTLNEISWKKPIEQNENIIKTLEKEIADFNYFARTIEKNPNDKTIHTFTLHYSKYMSHTFTCSVGYHAICNEYPHEGRYEISPDKKYLIRINEKYDIHPDCLTQLEKDIQKYKILSEKTIEEFFPDWNEIEEDQFSNYSFSLNFTKNKMNEKDGLIIHLFRDFDTDKYNEKDIITKDFTISLWNGDSLLKEIALGPLS